MTISKRDIASMSPEQRAAAERMWEVSSQEGQLAGNSFDAEEMAPKTWIICVNNKGEEMSFDMNGRVQRGTIECELYVVPRASDSSEAVGMLIGRCPKCGNNFTAREDNKQMTLDYVPYRKAPRHIRINWAWHCQHVLGKPVNEDEKLAVVSSSEPWCCDYCHEWGVRVQAGVATVDMSRVHKQVYVPPPGVHLIDVPKDQKTEF